MSGSGTEYRINRNIVECKGLFVRTPGLFSLVLIETLWNVKQTIRHLPISFFRINRNIVECKEVEVSMYFEEDGSINRNIVECKDFNRKSPYVASFVLIETLWNVKRSPVTIKLPFSMVLIETLWNVKEQP